MLILRGLLKYHMEKALKAHDGCMMPELHSFLLHWLVLGKLFAILGNIRGFDF